jgi:hypothetical protein
VIVCHVGKEHILYFMGISKKKVTGPGPTRNSIDVTYPVSEFKKAVRGGGEGVGIPALLHCMPHCT